MVINTQLTLFLKENFFTDFIMKQLFCLYRERLLILSDYVHLAPPSLYVFNELSFCICV